MKANTELGIKEDRLRNLQLVKEAMAKLRDYEKLYDELKNTILLDNLDAVADILRNSSFSDIVTNKHLILYSQLFYKFERLFLGLQTNILNLFDIRSEQSQIEQHIEVLFHLDAKRVL